ncbi:MAG: HAD-IIB family hydrolase [Oscillospiraceae bacterium]|nr:HAD-IIB family hydrolase [Oscillospiraceae bacterium]
MGIFDRWLIACDFDNTITNTHGVPVPEEYISGENAAAIRAFMEGGGTFAVATGRSLPDARPVALSVPSNAPTIIYNGAAIYDYEKETYVDAVFLTDSAPRIRDYMAAVLESFPHLGAEFYHEGDLIHACAVNEHVLYHRRLSDAPMIEVETPASVPDPIVKVLLEGPAETVKAAEEFILAQSWAGEVELIYSFDTLLEVTAVGGNKADAVGRLAKMLSVDPDKICCAGDHLNDIPMLLAAAVAFAPVSARDEVKALPRIRLIARPEDGSMADLLEKLRAIAEA